MAGMSAAGGRQQLMRDLDNGSLEITQSIEDDPLLEAPLPPHALHSWLCPKFYAIPTVCFANILLLIHVAFVILAFLAGMFCSYPDESGDTCPRSYTHPLKVQTTVMTAKVILWLLYVFLELCVHYHHSKARRRGYLLIYQNTRHLKRLPLLIQSAGNTALLLILSVQHSFPDHNKLYLCFILAILTVELVCSLICLVIYTVKVSNFNRAKPRPDIIEEEKMYAYPSRITSEVGFRDTPVLPSRALVQARVNILRYVGTSGAVKSASKKDFWKGSAYPFGPMSISGVDVDEIERKKSGSGSLLENQFASSCHMGIIQDDCLVMQGPLLCKDIHTSLHPYSYPRETSVLEEIVEKQGDVIEYLQRHNALLSKRLLALTSQQARS